MNKRDFMKSAAALSAVPAILSRTKVAAASIAERQKMRAERATLGPTPAYVYDSDRRTTTFWVYGENERAAFDYMRA